MMRGKWGNWRYLSRRACAPPSTKLSVSSRSRVNGCGTDSGGSSTYCACSAARFRSACRVSSSLQSTSRLPRGKRSMSTQASSPATGRPTPKQRGARTCTCGDRCAKKTDSRVLRPEGQSTLLQEYIEALAIDLEMDALEVRPREAGGRPQPPPAAYAHGERRIAVPRTHSIYKLVVGDVRFKHHYVTSLNHVQHRHAAAEHL